MPAFGIICRVWQEAATSGILIPHTMRKCRSGANPCSFIILCELHLAGLEQWFNFKQSLCLVNIFFRNNLLLPLQRTGENGFFMLEKAPSSNFTFRHPIVPKKNYFFSPRRTKLWKLGFQFAKRIQDLVGLKT